MAIQVKPNPISGDSKKQQVEEMFDNISPRYDFLNHFLSLGFDYSWRSKVRKNVQGLGAKYVLDVATGTADLAIELSKIEGSSIVGIDISQGMLDCGQIKLQRKKCNNRIVLIQADSEKLPFDNDAFEAITVSFGVRNFENLSIGLSEMYRVLKPSMAMVVLEFSKPSHPIFSRLYWFYFKNILPFLGKILSRSSNAYSYLPQSVEAFPEGEEFSSLVKSVGFKNVSIKPLTFGICTMYTCEK